MTNYCLRRWTLPIGLAVSLLCAVANQAQEASVVLTNGRLQGADFSFEIVAADLASCVVQSSESYGSRWTDLAMNPQSPFVVRIDRTQRFFRVRCGDLYSENQAGYLVTLVPRGYSMIANHFNRGSNTVTEILRSSPPRTVLYKFDAARQSWSAATEFEFGAWTHPDETLNPGEGAFLYAPIQFRQVYCGLLCARCAVPRLEDGHNLVSSPVPDVPSGDLGWPSQVGDTIYRYYTAWDQFIGSTYLGTGIGWAPHGFAISGESFWYDWSRPHPIWLGGDGSNPIAGAPPATVYFNNYSPETDVPFFGPDGTRLEGTNWVAQLYASTNLSGPFSAVGDPLSFLTGDAAGYLDTRPGALRVIPFVPSGSAFWGQARLWERKSGATWEEAVANNGRYELLEPVVTSTRLSPLSPPQIVNLQNHILPLDVNAVPTNQMAFEGGLARFYCPNTGGPGISYQWQRLQNATNWVDVPGATAFELVINPVAPDDAATYRLATITQGFQFFGHPVELRVLLRPRFNGFTSDLPSGSFSFTLTAEPGFNYRVEASDDLTNWVFAATLNNPNGSARFTDSAAGSFRHRFYRLAVRP